MVTETRPRGARRRWTIYIPLLIFSFLFITPFLWMLSTSLKTNPEIYHTPLTMLPHTLTLEHYIGIFTGLPSFFIYIRNSFLVTGVSLFLVVLLSALAGYAFGRMRFTGSGVWMLLIILVLAVPYAVYLIPVYMVEKAWHIDDTYIGLILPYVALNLPLAILIMRGTFRAIPLELEDSARIDGANPLQIWWLVMLPLARHGLATVTIFTFIAVWEEFMFAVTLMSPPHVTFPVGITFLKEEGAAWAFGTLSATITISLIPALIIFLSLQRYFIKGLMEGALRG